MISFDNTQIAFSSKSNSQLKRAYWLFKILGSPRLVSFGSSVAELSLKFHLPVKRLIKTTIFNQFCGGESIEDCAKTTLVLDAYRIGTILDYSVEGSNTETDYEKITTEILKTISTANNNENIPFCVFKVTGIARVGLLEKIGRKEMLSDLERREFMSVHDRVNRICEAAAYSDTPVFIDAEESWLQEPIDGLARKMASLYNKDKVYVFNTIQMYRHDRLEFMKKELQAAKTGGYKLGFKLVRGAYMEKERKRAKEMNYPSPIQPNKEATDRDFNLGLEYCIDNLDVISLCAGTHNEESSMKLVELIHERELSPNDPRIYFAQLFGMSDHISFNLSNAGYNVAKYVPYGPVKKVLPYLNRRAQENTSVRGQRSRELSLIQREIERRKKEKEMFG